MKDNQVVKWQYFFGGSSNNGRSFDRYYKAVINGKNVEMWCSNRGTKYSIGNMDKAKVRFSTEAELIDACYNDNKPKTEV